MASQFQTLTILFSLLLILTTISISTSSSTTTTFYDVLESNGLPTGLFPKGISDFSIDPSTGHFELHLQSSISPCHAEFETRVRYDWNITGTVSYGTIGNLSGVAAQELFLWLPVYGIRVDLPSSGLIYFDVGVVLKQFSLSFFETPKDCNVLGKEEGGKVVLFDGLGKIAENRAEKFVRERVADEYRAIS